VSDATGWNQLYVCDLTTGEHTQISSAPADHGAAAWRQGMRRYAWQPDGRGLIAIRNDHAGSSLWRHDVRTRRADPVRGVDSYTHLEQISVSGDGDVALIASSSTIPARIVSLNGEGDMQPLLNADAPGTTVLIETPLEARICARSSGENFSGLATAEPLAFTADDGETVYALYYPPTSSRFEDTAAPPLIVNVHGGPTSRSDSAFSLQAQFFATRGFAYVDVNHRGSTGYGRAYMDKLRGAWGVYDVDDSAAAARHLVERGFADPRRLVIIGRSAGGFTALLSLIKLPGFYRAGIAAYPVTDQFSAAFDTHKFEARYNDYLLGELPEAAALYRERSPLYQADKISDALLLFHGDQDPVVPVAQTQNIVAALQARGVPHEYHVYAGEGHGWRKPETTEDYYIKILDFLRRRVLFA
jgi:dipeptidyl aminopeptidase/acylaminoacyl peptidase